MNKRRHAGKRAQFDAAVRWAGADQAAAEVIAGVLKPAIVKLGSRIQARGRRVAFRWQFSILLP
jgi:hypothetical protein